MKKTRYSVFIACVVSLMPLWAPAALHNIPLSEYTNVTTAAGTGSSEAATLTVNLAPVVAPAFPGAEGAGANALGGRGGDIYYVTNLNDSGAGSLRYGIENASGPRTILFKISGNILLESDLAIECPYLTIAGQTAPGDGITLQGRLTSVQNCNDVVVRYIRTRPGDIYQSDFQDDSFHFMRATNCIIDHVSASWSIDEALSCTHYSTNITVQWCFISESLTDSYHDKGAHGYGSLIRYGHGAISYHHNLYADHSSRNPRVGDNIKLDFVNNVVYNWGFYAGYNADDSSTNTEGFTNVLNYVGNYLIAGPNTSSRLTTAFQSSVTDVAHFQLFQSGNRIDSDKDGKLDGVNTGTGMFSGFYTAMDERYPVPAVSTDTAPVAYERVLAFAGASAVRDAVDARVVNDVIEQAGALIDSQDDVGGFPELNSAEAPEDRDVDGIPDYWEEVIGWDPDAANNNHLNADGFSDLEWYLNWLAGAHATCSNTTVNIDLCQAVGGLTNLAFSVIDGTNGTVTLLADGCTARFSRSGSDAQMADFSFTCTNTVTGVGFGPVTVGIALLAQPVLYWEAVDGGVEFSWEGASMLQFLPNSLIPGTNWLHYPDTNNPVTVPYGSVLESVFFRLSK